MKRVYIAGPYTAPTEAQIEQNVRIAIEAADAIRMLGYTVFVPHLYHYWHKLFPHKHDYWMELDHEWLEECDILVCLEGKSDGTLIDIGIAESLPIPVYSFGEFVRKKHPVTT